MTVSPTMAGQGIRFSGDDMLADLQGWIVWNILTDHGLVANDDRDASWAEAGTEDDRDRALSAVASCFSFAPTHAERAAIRTVGDIITLVNRNCT